MCRNRGVYSGASTACISAGRRGHRALTAFAQSQEAFDLWFKQQMADVTGVDLNNPPSGPLSEQLSSYED